MAAGRSRDRLGAGAGRRSGSVQDRGQSGVLRIIGGEWRGRKLRFRAARGLRPTPDRVSETVFNWLAPHIHGVRCLDLFAGSGALGLEALSRGAGFVRFIDNNAGSLARIEEHLASLDCSSADCRAGDALRLLKVEVEVEAFDIVFLDPPFGESLLEPVAHALEEGRWLAPDALIYLEAGSREPPPALPDTWQLHREKTMGDVRFSLFVRAGQFV
jgi:16S rRNA (guanine966-N2)-methyltransferase